MRVSLVLSLGFHIAVFVFAIYGLPSTSKSIVIDHQVIDVELIAVTETPDPETIPKQAPPREKVKAPPPPPLKPPEPPKQVASLPPEPAPLAPPEPAPKLKAKKLPKPPPKRVAPRPKPRPKPDFASMMLKTVQKLKETPSAKPENPKEKKKSFDEKMATLMKRQSRSQPERAPVGENLSISEIDAIRRQIERCWLAPALIGAKDVGEMAVQIRMKLNPDGTLRESRIVDRFRMETNPSYKAVAESALRAVRNPRCNKFTLPLQKYDVWKDMVLRFNPSEMVGR